MSVGIPLKIVAGDTQQFLGADLVSAMGMEPRPSGGTTLTLGNALMTALNLGGAGNIALTTVNIGTGATTSAQTINIGTNAFSPGSSIVLGNTTSTVQIPGALTVTTSETLVGATIIGTTPGTNADTLQVFAKSTLTSGRTGAADHGLAVLLNGVTNAAQNGIDVSISSATAAGDGISVTHSGLGTALVANAALTGNAFEAQDNGTPVLTVTGAGAITAAPTSGQSFTVDTLAAGGISLDSAAASNFTTTVGALTITSAVAATWGTTAGVLTLNGTAGIELQGNATTALSINAAGTSVLFDDTASADFMERAGDPGGTANQGKIYTKDVSTVTQLFYQDSAGVVTQLSAAATLQSAYVAGNTISVTTGEGAVQISDSADLTNTLEVSRTFAGGGVGVAITMGAGGEAVTGTGLDAYSGTGATGDTAVFQNDGTGKAIQIFQNKSGVGLAVLKSTATSTGHGITVAGSAGTSGNLIDLTQNIGGVGLSIVGTGGGRGTMLFVNSSTGSNLLTDLQWNSNSMFSVNPAEIKVKMGSLAQDVAAEAYGTFAVIGLAVGSDPNQYAPISQFRATGLQTVSTSLSEVSPEGVITANPGSITHVRYPLADPNDGLWVKTTLTGNTGWSKAAVTTDIKLQTAYDNSSGTITTTAAKPVVITNAVDASSALKVNKTGAFAGNAIEITLGAGSTASAVSIVQEGTTATSNGYSVTTGAANQSNAAIVGADTLTWVNPTITAVIASGSGTFTAADVGRTITITGSASNDGDFVITSYFSGTITWDNGESGGTETGITGTWAITAPTAAAGFLVNAPTATSVGPGLKVAYGGKGAGVLVETATTAPATANALSVVNAGAGVAVALTGTNLAGDRLLEIAQQSTSASGVNITLGGFNGSTGNGDSLAFTAGPNTVVLVSALATFTANDVGRTITITGANNQTGVGDSVTVGPTQTLTDAAGLFTALHVGQPITITGMSNGVNNGTFTIASFISATQITYANGAGVAETSAFIWSIALAGVNDGSFTITVYNSPTSVTWVNATGESVTTALTWTVVADSATGDAFISTVYMAGSTGRAADLVNFGSGETLAATSNGTGAAALLVAAGSGNALTVQRNGAIDVLTVSQYGVVTSLAGNDGSFGSNASFKAGAAPSKAGGTLSLASGNGGTGTGTNGGPLNILAGNGGTGTVAAGGTVSITAGNGGSTSGNPGGITILGGDSTVSGAFGGDVSIDVGTYAGFGVTPSRILIGFTNGEQIRSGRLGSPDTNWQHRGDMRIAGGNNVTHFDVYNDSGASNKLRFAVTSAGTAGVSAVTQFNGNIDGTNQYSTMMTFAEQTFTIPDAITTVISLISPEGVVTANEGSVCHVQYAAPNANDGLWVKLTGTGNTGWAKVSTGSGSGTLQTAYDNATPTIALDASGGIQFTQADGAGVGAATLSLTNAEDSVGNNTLTISRSPVTTAAAGSGIGLTMGANSTGNGIAVTMGTGATGAGISTTGGGSGRGISVTQLVNSAGGILVTQTGVTATPGIEVAMSAAATATGYGISITGGGALSSGAAQFITTGSSAVTPSVRVNATGAGTQTALDVDSDGAHAAVTITNSGSGETCIITASGGGNIFELRRVATPVLSVFAAGSVYVTPTSGQDFRVDTLAAGGISLDSAAASNFSVTGANLTLSTITSGNVVITAASATGDINLTARGAAAIPFNGPGVGDVSLVGFTATSVVGALNELKVTAVAASQIVQTGFTTTTNKVTTGLLGYLTTSAGVVQRAIATSLAESLVFGANEGTSGKMTTAGTIEAAKVQASIAITIGDRLFLSATDAGCVTNVAPVTVTQVVLPVGYARTAAAAATNAPGTGDGTAALTFSTPTVTLTDGTVTFLVGDVGKTVRIAGAISAANNGDFPIVGSTTTLQWTNAAGVAESFTGATWRILSATDLLMQIGSPVVL